MNTEHSIASQPAAASISVVQLALPLLFQTLEKLDVPYCVLRNFEGLPEQTGGSDLDFLVHPERRDKLHQALSEWLELNGARCIESRWESARTLFVILGDTGEPLVLDMLHDLRYHGLRYGDARDVLQRRQRHERGFFVPEPVDEAVLKLIHSLLTRGRIHQKYWASIRKTQQQHPAAFERRLAVLFPDPMAEEMSDAVGTGDWSRLEQRRRVLAVLRGRDGGRIREAWWLAGKLWQRGRNVVRPRGIVVALIGPDGAGKTTVANHVVQALEQAHIDVAYEHVSYRPGILFDFHLDPPPVKRAEPVGQEAAQPLGQPPKVSEMRRKRNMSSQRLKHTLRLAYHLTDYILFYWWRVYPFIIEGNVFLFDRYFYDHIAAPSLVKDAPVWLQQVVRRFVPTPHITVLLSNAPEAIYARKQELPITEIRRQLAMYRAIIQELPEGVELQTSEPPDVVAKRVVSRVLAQRKTFDSRLPR